MSRRLLLALLPLCLAAAPCRAQTRVEAAANTTQAPRVYAPAADVSRPPSLSLGTLGPLAASPLAAAPRLAPAAAKLRLPKPTLAAPAAAASPSRGPERTAESARAEADALFDARRLQPDDKIGLILGGFREADNRLLAPQTGAPATNAQMRAIHNSFLESRSRGTLLRLAHETSSEGSNERKNALLSINRDALPREVLKAGPAKERATILRRLASLYRRWIERAPSVGDEVVAPANARAEEKLGALLSEAVVKRFEEDGEGRRLLDQLRDKRGALRLPTMRVLRLENAGALYTSYGRQLVINLDYLRQCLLPRLPATERAQAAKSLETEAGALEYLLQSPARPAALADAIDVTLFHELVHFRQDLERPLMTAIKKEDAPSLMTLEHEYEAYFRQNLYIHSLLARPGASLDIDRLDEYLRLLDSFESWKAHIDGAYGATFLNAYTSMEELARLQDKSHGLIRRLSGSNRSVAASQRLEAAERGAAAIATEGKAAQAELAEYRKRWPALAREGLERWARISEGRGRWPEAALAQDKRSRLAETPAEAEAWSEKADRAADTALIKLAAAESLSLDDRIMWINALVGRSNDSASPWKKELWIAYLRDYALQAQGLRAAAGKAAGDAERKEFLRRAATFADAVDSSRAALRGMAETNLAQALTEKDPRHRDSLIEWGAMQAEVLGDAALIASFKTLSQKTPRPAGRRQ